jgi:hypothetical protein
MSENWKSISNFDNYSVSDWGNVRSDRFDRILTLSQNQYDVVYVGLVRDGSQYHRSVPLLVANAFIPREFEPYDTPINLNGDRFNNHVSNLVWRPRWFAIKYNQQFKFPYEYPIINQIEDLKTGEVSQDSFECAKRYGLLEKDLVLSILNHTYVWPTYQQFRVIRI